MARLQKRKKCSISTGLNLIRFKSSSLNQIYSWQWFYLIFVICFLNLIISVASQSVLVPLRMNAGQNNTLLLISNKDTSATLEVFIGQNPILKSDIDFKKDEILAYPLWINSLAGFTDRKTKVEVTFENGRVSEQDVQIYPFGGSFFFQMDKPIYKIEETVRFRMLRLDSFMNAINETVKLTIFNSQRLKLEEVYLKTEPPFYIADYSYNFPSFSKYGIWSAVAHYGPELKSNQTITFELDQYTLPKFKAKIIVPKYLILSRSRDFEVKMNVDYIYDRVLNGTVYLNIGYLENGDPNKFKHHQSTNIKCFINGRFAQNITLENHGIDLSIAHFPLIVKAIVRDCATNDVHEFLSDPIVFVNSPFKISTENTITRYKAKTRSHVIVEVVDPTGVPLPNVALDVKIRPQDKSNNRNITIQTITITKNPEGTDENGRYVSTFKIEDVGTLEVDVSTVMPGYKAHEQAHQSFIIEPFDNQEKEHVFIMNRKYSNYEAGDIFSSQIETNHHFTSLYLIVSSKGVVYHYEKLKSSQFKFKITNQMAPTVRVLVLGVNDDSRIFSDFVRLKVKHKNCGPQISLKGSNVTLPGKSVTFLVDGEQGDVVGLHAIDEAIYVHMQSDPNSGFKQFEKSLTENDLGCGPGSGKTSLHSIRNAGFLVISSNQKNYKIFIPDFCKKTQSIYRKKRSNDIRLIAYNQMYQKRCCSLGKENFVKHISCDKRRQMVQKRFDETCAKYTFDCCRAASFQKTAASASTEIKTQSFPIVLNTAGLPGMTSSAGLNGLPISSDRRRLQEVTTEFRSDIVKSSKEQEIEEEEKQFRHQIRQDFRETWLFDLFTLENDRKITKKAPDSITSWVTSVISLSKRDGFCYSNQLRLTTFKPFFVEVSIPRVIVENEQTEVVIYVYNYNPHNMAVTLKFFRIQGICSNWGMNKGYISENASIEGHGSRRFSFPILPYRRGTFEIKVTVEDSMNNYSDTLVKNLTIIPRGILKEENINFIINPKSPIRHSREVINNVLVSQNSSSSYHLTEVILEKAATNTTNIVPNTLKFFLYTSGSRFLPAVETKSKFLEFKHKSNVYGIDNMNQLAHHLYSYMYSNTNEERKNNALHYIKQSLWNQLKDRNEDGSFSLIKGSSLYSVQFTAFVTKIMCQAAPYVKLDSNIILGGLNFLLSKQNNFTGSWSEQISYGNDTLIEPLDPLTLTAYVLSAIQHCSSHETFNQNSFRQMIFKAEKFIETDFIQQTPRNSYQKAMSAYALSYGNKDELIERLLSQTLASANIEHKDQLYWATENESHPFDTAALVLLTKLKRGKRDEKLNFILNWMSNQTKLDESSSTLDLTFGLEAMFESYKKNLVSQVIKLHFNVHFDKRFRKELHLDMSNADLIQAIDVDPGTNNISIYTEGIGTTRMSLIKTFNEFHPDETCLFDISIRFKEFKPSAIPVDSGIANEDMIFGNLEIFDEKVNEMANELGGRTSSNSDDNQKSAATCCFKKNSIKRKKRSWNSRNFFRKLLYLKKYESSKPKENSSSNSIKSAAQKKNSESNSSNQNKYFPTLPKLHEHNVNIKVLNICVRHLSDSNAGMTALEINLLSGYEAIIVDLENIKNISSYISHYEIVANKIFVYYISVPYTRADCSAIRIYEKNHVSNRQPAIIKLYKISPKSYSCVRLYWDVETRPQTYKYECNETCKCRTNKLCPNSDVVGEIFSRKTVAHNNLALMRNFFCSYKIAFIGKVVEKKESPIRNQTHSMTIEVLTSYRFGDKIRDRPNIQNYTIKLSSICEQNLKNPGGIVLVMHNSLTDMLFDGDSVLVDLKHGNDESKKKFIEEFVRIIKRTGQICES